MRPVAALFLLALCAVGALASPNVAVDLYRQTTSGAAVTPGFISLSQISSIGASGALAIEIDCILTVSPGSTRSSLLYLADSQLTNVNHDVEIYLVGQVLHVRVNTDDAATTGSIGVYNAWTYIAVNIANDATTGNANVQVYVNGVAQTLTKSQLGYPLTSGVRAHNFVGYSTYGGVSNFAGMVDSLVLWDQPLDAATISAHAAMAKGSIPFTVTDLIVRFDFNEGYGQKTQGSQGLAGAEPVTGTLSYPNALFVDPAIIGTGLNPNWIQCAANGDPHWYVTFAGGQIMGSQEHPPGMYKATVCSTPACGPAFLVGVINVPYSCLPGVNEVCDASTNCVIRGTYARLGNSVFRHSFQEAVDYGLVGAGVPASAGFLYKNLAPGASEDSTPWQTWVPSLTQPLVLSSGLTVSVSSISPLTYQVTAAPFGYYSYVEANGDQIDIWVDKNQCFPSGFPTGDNTACVNSDQSVASWTAYYSPIIFPVSTFAGVIADSSQCGGGSTGAPAPLTAVTPSSAPVTAPNNTCPCTGDLLAAATSICTRKWPTDQGAYAACFYDVCCTGIIDQPPQNCTVGVPCCNCASTGTCQINPTDNSTSCACDAGFGGADCSQPLQLLPLNLTTSTAQSFDGLPFTLAPYTMDGQAPTSPAAGASATVITGFLNQLTKSNKFSIKNSLLAYIGSVSSLASFTTSGTTFAEHMYFISDASSSPTGETLSLGITYTGFTAATDGSNAATPIGPSSYVTMTGSLPTTVGITTSPVSPNGFVLPNLPANPWCINVAVSGYSGQILVGSGNINGQLDILKVDGNTFKICGTTVTNPCTNYLNCGDCAADYRCGWCRTTGECRYGRPAGPTDGTLCTAWAYSFNTGTSRRVTQSYGYPVTPMDTTVVLSSGTTDLPIEINVNMGYRAYATWDVQILFPVGPSNQADLSGLQNTIGSVAQMLAANYPNSALALSTYSSGTVNQIFPLVNPSGASSSMASAAGTIVVGGSDATANEFPALVTRAINTATWRTNTRRVVIVFTTTSAPTGTTSTSADLVNLVAQNVLPAFVSTQSNLPSWSTYATNAVPYGIGFGLTELYTSPSNIAVLVNRVLTDAAGSISALVDVNNQGPVDFTKLNPVASTLQITGMSNGMRSRTIFPVLQGANGNSEKSVILIPGFGKSTIEAIPGDAPYTTGGALTLTVNTPLTPWSSQTGGILYLSGSPVEVLQSFTTQVAATVTGISFAAADFANGTLYQFDETILSNVGVSGLTAITSFPTQVTDAQNRLLFIATPNTFSTAKAPVFATVSYYVNDECEDSPIGTIPIYVKYADNEPPTSSPVAVTTPENVPIVLTFTGVDNLGHNLQTVITSTVSNGASTLSALSGYLYQYSAACLAAANAAGSSTTGVITGCTLINNGDVLTSTTTVDASNSFVYTTTAQAIYVPYTFANSDGIPAVYKTTPSLSYQMVQIANAQDTGAFVPLVTPVLNVPITVTHVNQAPTVAFPAPGAYLSLPAILPTLDSSDCGALTAGAATCAYQQNLGVAFPSLPAAISVFFQGSDVDNAVLYVNLLSLSCVDPLAKTLNISTGAQVSNIVSPTLLGSFTADSYAALLSFLPSQDAAGTPYCTMTYNVWDGELFSQDSGSITITVSSVPLPPRSQDYRFFAPTLAALPFTFSARAVDNLINNQLQLQNISSVTISQCSGDLTSTLVIQGNKIDCTTPFTYTIATPGAGDAVLSNSQEHTFSGAWTPTENSILNGFSVNAVFADTQGLSSIAYTLSFAYRQVDQPPGLLYIQPGVSASDYSKYSQSSVNTVNFRLSNRQGGGSIGFYAIDSDAPSSALENATIVVSPASSNYEVSFPGDVQGLVVSTGQGNFQISAPIGTISQILATTTVNIHGVSSANFTVTITVNDQGYTGSCSADIATPCNKQAVAVLIVGASSAAPVAAYGLAAGAGAAAAGAAAAAAIAWRKLRTPPTEDYNPWDMDDSNEGTVMSPLFESAGKSGDNLLYVAAAK